MTLLTLMLMSACHPVDKSHTADCFFRQKDVFRMTFHVGCQLADQ